MERADDVLDRESLGWNYDGFFKDLLAKIP